jgi:hypothetical protein
VIGDRRAEQVWRGRFAYEQRGAAGLNRIAEKNTKDRRPTPGAVKYGQRDGHKGATRMRALLFGLAALATVPALDAALTEAQAYPVYPWCAYYSGRGGTNCYFSTFAQCQAAVSGVGGTCSQNPFYGAGGYASARAKRYRRH